MVSLVEHFTVYLFVCPQELLEVNSKFCAKLQKSLEESVAKGDEVTASVSFIENSREIHVTGAKRGKTRMTRSRLVLVLYLIG